MASNSDKTQWLPAVVWLARILVGVTFVVSGMAKCIDPWSTIYKIEQYLAVWQWDMPRAVVMAGSVALSSTEFIAGLLLATGSYKRVAVWGLTAMMAFMLPLTAYIAIYDPVADCGCFGDFIILSNPATFAKNVVITAILVWLLFVNRRVSGLFSAYSQWLQGMLALVLALTVAMIGYNVQPLVDFRSYPVGTRLSSDNDADALTFRFIYERDGERHTFAEDSLPDESWTFVDREIAGGNADMPASLRVYDFDGDDVTQDAVSSVGRQVLLLIPEIGEAGIASTYQANELDSYMKTIGGSMVAVVAGSPDDVEQWIDLAMAQYPVYTAEDTAIKELARGGMALVGLTDGVVAWKRTLQSIDPYVLDSPSDSLFDTLAGGAPSPRDFWLYVLIWAGAELAVWAMDRSGRFFVSRKSKKNP